jgi:GNAT superfamily N-acetyltransferase
MSEAVFERHSGEQALMILDSIIDLYDNVNSEMGYESVEIFSRKSFIARTRRQIEKDGFELITVRSDNVLAGFSFGYTFPPGVWWAGAALPATEVLDASKLAVIELNVQSSYRGRGFGKRLLQTLLEHRDEKLATLTAIPDDPAYSMYMRWGWRKLGELTGDGPAMDILMLSLRTEADPG